MIKLFTHSDLDGIGCAILAYLAFGKDNVDVSFCNYDDINELVEEFFNNYSAKTSNTQICDITDISISEELASKIDKKGITRGMIFHLLDHHPTALELNKYDWCTIKVNDEVTNIKTSGTEMYYKWLLDHNVLETNVALGKFVDIVRNYDTWQWSTLGDEGVICKQVNDLLYLYGRDKFIDWCIAKINNNSFPNFGELEYSLLDIRQKEIDTYVEEKNKQLRIRIISGKTGGFVFAEKYFSELGNRICKMRPEIDFIGMIDLGRRTISYRSIKEDFDLGNFVANTYNGGGHKQAAGSQFSPGVQADVMNYILNY